MDNAREQCRLRGGPPRTRREDKGIAANGKADPEK